MSHDDFATEPVPGLPETPPEGERILWQGAPDWRSLLWRAFALRWVLLYFAALAVWRGAEMVGEGQSALAIAASVAALTPLVVVAAAVLALIAWLTARSSVYTITTRRIVMKFGIALPKAFNLPYAEIEAVDVRERGGGLGDIALRFKPDVRLAWLIFWPHVRGLRMARTEPQLVCIQDVGEVADLLARQLHAHVARTHDVEQVLEGKPDDDAVVPFPQAAE